MTPPKPTWETNRELINGLWPMAQFTTEEADLWRADLSGLDQDALLEAIRQVKRTRDTIYPQLAWIHEEYRAARAKAKAQRPPGPGPLAFHGPRLQIDPKAERHLRSKLEALVDDTDPTGLDAVVERITQEIDHLEARSVIELLARARARRDGEELRCLPPAKPARGGPLVIGPEETPEEIEARRQAALRLFQAMR